MLLGLLTIASIPTVIGVAEGVSAQNKESNPETSSKVEAERMRKFNLECSCENKSRKAREIDGGQVVLRGEKLYILPHDSNPDKIGHLFEGFYIGYPDPDRPQPPPLGLVSTISKDPPMLNWIYVDKDTCEVKYGNRTQSRAHIVGSWGWDAGEEGGAGGLTLEGKERAVAVELDGKWEIRWEDKDGKVGVQGRRKLTVSLERKFVELTEEEEQEQGREQGKEGEKRTETNIELTKTTFERSKKTTGEPGRVDKAIAKNARECHDAPKLEIKSTTVEKPIKDG